MLVAIDIAKARNEVLIEVPGRQRRRKLSIRNTRDDHDRLVALLLETGKTVICGFEATGNYHRPIAWRLIQAGFDVRLVSSMAAARTREALHNSWDKNDPKDAQVILHMLGIGATQHYHDPLLVGINDVQELSKTHEAISRSKTEILHRLLTHYLPLYFPEVERFRQNSRSDWFFAFLEIFPTPASITVMDEAAFIEAAWQVVGRKVSKARLLADIYQTAQASIALPIPLDAPAITMFRMVLAQARSLIRQRDAIEKMADAMLAHSPDYQQLRKIPGIGPINALSIIAEAGDIRRFGHHRQFLKFCGLDLSTHQSGVFRGRTKLSKYGNARLATGRAIRSWPPCSWRLPAGDDFVSELIGGRFRPSFASPFHAAFQSFSVVMAQAEPDRLSTGLRSTSASLGISSQSAGNKDGRRGSRRPANPAGTPTLFSTPGAQV